MQFIDLAAQQERIRPSIERRIAEVLRHGQYIMGPEVRELEEKLEALTGARHCIGVANGTDALMIALMALGVGPGDEVVTSAFSFIAAAEAAMLLGATPVFVDIDADSYNLDPDALEAAITPATKAIIPVDLFGQCAEYERINAIANRHGIAVIEDAAQSLGATRHGRAAGALAELATTSFFPSKPLGGYGDAGACFTADDELAAKIRSIRVHGQGERYSHRILGVNGRIDTLQAAILLAKLEIFDDEVARRGALGRRYDALLAGTPGVVLPSIAPGNSSVYAQYTVMVEDRAAVRQRLAEAGIPTAVHYPSSLPEQPVFASLGVDPARFPRAVAAAARVMSLPMHPYLTEAQQAHIAESLAAAVAAPLGAAS